MRWVSRQDAGFVRSLEPIRRVRLSELDLTDYHLNHVLSAVPLIVELPVAEGEALWDRDALLRACANETVTLLSTATRTTLRKIRGTALETVFSLALRFLSSEGGLEELVRSRDSLALSALARRMEQEAEREARAKAASSAPWWRRRPLLSASPRSVIWPIAVLAKCYARCRSHGAAASLDAILRVVLSPTYLYDVPVGSVCAALERTGGAVARAYARQANLTDARWLASLAEANGVALTPFEVRRTPAYATRRAQHAARALRIVRAPWSPAPPSLALLAPSADALART